MPMNESTRHVDLLRAFAKSACPICALVLRDMQQDMDTLMLERINKVETHLMFRAGRGLCNAHAWGVMRAKGGSLGIAVMYESTLLSLMKDVAKVKPMGTASGFRRFLGGGKSVGDSAANQLEPTGDCLLCTLMNKNESSYVNIVAENVHDSQLQQAYRDSDGGVCLPHSRMVIRLLKNPDDIHTLMDIQTAKWHELQAELQLFIQENEDNVPQSEMGKEGDSWQRAIRYLSGEKDVFGYRR
ncbi:MAG: DUF6062 family protein [Anaerolineae bacterium]|nr:DUF6062 family protein [Anaerolineae bacterium]MDQ7037128.1 DUF6062 family protein [Anaerolineae bacterium]